MERKIIETADGSKTIQLVEWDEQYHSKHGAVQEAYHVFIASGLSLFSNQYMSLLEIGFGTGLNAFITLLESRRLQLRIAYTGVEKYPIPEHEWRELNYPRQLGSSAEEAALFLKMHTGEWERALDIHPNFTLCKQQKDFFEIHDENKFDLIYFDAFGARVQPELWTETLFQKMYNALHEKGFLVTYAAKGSVRRAMEKVGFKVERLPGPPGKREMLRAQKF